MVIIMKDAKLLNRLLNELLFGRLSHIPMEKHAPLIKEVIERSEIDLEEAIKWIGERYERC